MQYILFMRTAISIVILTLQAKNIVLLRAWCIASVANLKTTLRWICLRLDYMG